jgi:hypothetical protein
MQGDIDDADIDAAVMGRISHLLSQIEESDFERVDPPAAVWDRIRASVTSDLASSPKQPPSCDRGAGMVVEYWIDGDDVVTDVGDAWADFARENDAAELATLTQDRTLWTYFDKEDVRELWQLLVARVRALETEVKVPLRCDAPHARRWFELTIAPEPDGRVHFRSVLDFEEARSSVALLDPSRERDDDAQPVPVCSWCGRGQFDARWLDIEEIVQSARLLEQTSLPPISYGICPSCRDEMSAELLLPARAGESGA